MDGTRVDGAFPIPTVGVGAYADFHPGALGAPPTDVRAAVLEVLSKPLVSELLSMRLTLVPEELPLPELVAT